MINFEQLTKSDDLNFANSLVAPEGWDMYRRMEDEWFVAGVHDAADNKAPYLTWCKPYMVGYRTHQTVKMAVAAIPTMMWQRGN